MAVPEEIRRVLRPKNTFVTDSKTDIYAVREKVGCGYYVDENGKRHRPSKNGKVIGHIINGVYVPKQKQEEEIPEVGEVDLKDYGNVQLCCNFSKDILTSLKEHYNKEDSEMLYVMSVLRACYDGIQDYMLERQYEETFLSEMYDVNLDKSKVSRFLRNVGRSGSRIVSFMKDAVSRCEDDDVIIFDGTLKRNESDVNSYSAPSRKTSAQRYRHVNIMTAYSVNKREQIASRVYPGNMVDQKIVIDFINSLEISDATVVADRGFPPEVFRASMIGHPDLKYIVPLNRDRKIIDELSLREMDMILPGTGITCKKTKSTDEHGNDVWYYSFRDPAIAAFEETHYVVNHSGEKIDPKELSSNRNEYGTIVFATNIDDKPVNIRNIYAKRWLIETSFKFQRSQLGDDTTDEESDYTVQASQFVDHLSSIMASRMRNLFEDSGLLDKRTYGEVYNLLLRLKMTREDGKEWKLRRIADRDAETSVVLGLICKPIVPTMPKDGKRGRPKGSKDKQPRKKKGKAAGRGLKETVSVESM